MWFSRRTIVPFLVLLFPVCSILAWILSQPNWDAIFLNLTAEQPSFLVKLAVTMTEIIKSLIGNL